MFPIPFHIIQWHSSSQWIGKALVNQGPTSWLFISVHHFTKSISKLGLPDPLLYPGYTSDIISNSKPSLSTILHTNKLAGCLKEESTLTSTYTT